MLHIFKSKYPGLRLDLEEVELRKGKNTVLSMRSAQFSPAPGESFGYFQTEDDALAKELREHTSYGKDFVAVEKNIQTPELPREKRPGAR